MVPKVPHGSTLLKVPVRLCAQRTVTPRVLQPNTPRIKLVLFTVKPAPPPNFSLLSTKSSFSCHPSLRPGGRAPATLNSDPVCRRKTSEGSGKPSPSLTSPSEYRGAAGTNGAWDALFSRLLPLWWGPAPACQCLEIRCHHQLAKRCPAGRRVRTQHGEAAPPPGCEAASHQACRGQTGGHWSCVHNGEGELGTTRNWEFLLVCPADTLCV